MHGPGISQEMSGVWVESQTLSPRLLERKGLLHVLKYRRGKFFQGNLTEGDGSVQVTSSCTNLFSSPNLLLKMLFTCYCKTSYLSEEANRTEPPPQLVFHGSSVHRDRHMHIERA
jgi:hypothetical protein